MALLWRAGLAIFIAALIEAGGVALAQRSLPEDNLAIPVLVTVGSTTGSGFYLMTEKGVWFVTAKHVLFDENGKVRSESASLLAYSLERNSAGTLMTLDLKELAENGLLKSHQQADAAVVQVATSDKPVTEKRELKIVAGVTLNRIAPEGIFGPLVTSVAKYDDVVVGNDVYVFGFPNSVGLKNIPQVDQQRPLLRRGIVAGRNDSLKTIIIDCPMFPGNSGGPVMEVDSDNFTHHFRIIGIASEFVPFDNSGWSAAIGGNATILNSGFSVVVPIDVAIELMGEPQISPTTK